MFDHILPPEFRQWKQDQPHLLVGETDTKNSGKANNSAFSPVTAN